MYRQGPPARFSLTPGVAGPAHAHGENTVRILEEIGLSSDEIEKMLDKKIVAAPDPRPETPRSSAV